MAAKKIGKAFQGLKNQLAKALGLSSKTESLALNGDALTGTILSTEKNIASGAEGTPM